MKGQRFSCREARFSKPSEPTGRDGIRRRRNRIRSVAMNQTSVDIRIRKPSALFRFSKSTDGIDFHSGSHFKRYKKPQYRKKVIATRQALCTQDGIVAAGPFKISHTAGAAINSAGQEDIQFSS